MRRTITGLAATLALATVVVPASAGSHTTCFGRSATIVGTARNERIEGTPGDDVIAGLNGRDRIFGKGGDDLVCGGGADNNETGEDLGDFLVGGEGADSIDAGRGDDVIHGGPGDDLLLGVEGVLSFGDKMHGGPGDDRIVGTSRGDTIRPGPGRDSVDGRGSIGGDDLLDYRASKRGMEVDLARGLATGEGRDRFVHVESVIGSPYADLLRGDDEANDLSGRHGPDRVYGRGGDDFLSGGTSRREENSLRDDDFLSGGPGDDALGLTGGTDVALGGGGTDRFGSGGGVRQVIRGGAGKGESVSFGTGPVTLDLGTGQGTVEETGALEVSSIDDVYGSPHDDVLVGDEGPNRISGGLGDDALDGGAGVDRLLHQLWGCSPCTDEDFSGVVVDLQDGTASGHGDDVVTGFEEVAGTSFRDVLRGTAGADYLLGSLDRDELFGQEGDDILDGGPDDDLGSGGPGVDTCVEVEDVDGCEL